MWVVLFNEPDFPIATPALEALLEADGGRGFSEPGLENQAINAVFPCEAGRQLRAMLRDPAFQAAGDADVERAVLAAGEDVDPVGHGGASR